MNLLKKCRLKSEQKALMRERGIYERLQTEHSEDAHFYHYMQAKLDNLDEQAEHIRGVLEGWWKI